MALITDGYQTLIYFNVVGDPQALFREKTVTPPALDSNGVLDTTTMRNLRFRSFQPKRLLGVPAPMTCEVQFDPVIFNTFGGIVLLLNRVDFIVIQFPDATQIVFYGWIGKFAVKTMKEGEFASADIDVHNSFQDAAGNVVPLAWGTNNAFHLFGPAQATIPQGI